MKDGLSIKFNHRAPKGVKEIKTEADIKVGARSDGYGGTMYVRAGKIVSHSPAKIQAQKLNEFRQAAGEVAAKSARKAQVSRELSAPESVQKLQTPTL